MTTVSIPRICLIFDCERKHSCRGLCEMHYQRLRVTGTTEVIRGSDCSVEGCDREFYGRNLCHMHYQRLKKRGTTEPTQVLDDATRFWANVDKTPGFGPDGDCWRWKGMGESARYGSFTLDGVTMLAHRYAFFVEHGHYPHPVGRHTCDTPACVRPDHIIEGTHSQNTLDAVSRGRWPDQAGECNPAAKLSEPQVREIRQRRSGGERPAMLARAFNISASLVSMICNFQRWKHVT